MMRSQAPTNKISNANVMDLQQVQMQQLLQQSRPSSTATLQSVPSAPQMRTVNTNSSWAQHNGNTIDSFSSASIAERNNSVTMQQMPQQAPNQPQAPLLTTNATQALYYNAMQAQNKGDANINKQQQLNQGLPTNVAPGTMNAAQMQQMQQQQQLMQMNINMQLQLAGNLPLQNRNGSLTNALNADHSNRDGSNSNLMGKNPALLGLLQQQQQQQKQPQLQRRHSQQQPQQQKKSSDSELGKRMFLHQEKQKIQELEQQLRKKMKSTESLTGTNDTTTVLTPPFNQNFNPGHFIGARTPQDPQIKPGIDPSSHHQQVFPTNSGIASKRNSLTANSNSMNLQVASSTNGIEGQSILQNNSSINNSSHNSFKQNNLQRQLVQHVQKYKRLTEQFNQQKRTGGKNSPQLLRIQKELRESRIVGQELQKSIKASQFVNNKSISKGTERMGLNSWQSNDNSADRQQIIQSIVEVIRETQPSETVSEKVPKMAERLEERLYKSAKSKQEYVDRSTLKKRLQVIAVNLCVHKAEKNTKEGEKVSKPKASKNLANIPNFQIAPQLNPNSSTPYLQDASDPKNLNQMESNTAPYMIGQGKDRNSSIGMHSSSSHLNGSAQFTDLNLMNTEHLQWQKSAIDQQPPVLDEIQIQKKKVVRQQQQRLLLLRHASKCTRKNCPTRYCAQMVKLWNHMKKCRDKDCKTPHCLSSRCVLNHYRICKTADRTATCEVCAPVIRVIRQKGLQSGNIQLDAFPSLESIKPLTPVPSETQSSMAAFNMTDIQIEPPKQFDMQSGFPGNPNSQMQHFSGTEQKSLQGRKNLQNLSVSETRENIGRASPHPGDDFEPILNQSPRAMVANQNELATFLEKLSDEDSGCPDLEVPSVDHKGIRKRKEFEFNTVENSGNALEAKRPAKVMRLNNEAQYNHQQPMISAKGQSSTNKSPTRMEIRKICSPLIQNILNDSDAWVFRDPVDPEQLGLPDYFDVIKNPMDLSLVEKRLETLFYEDLEHFKKETCLVFDNAILYNGEDSDVGKMATKLMNMFVEKFSNLNLN